MKTKIDKIINILGKNLENDNLLEIKKEIGSLIKNAENRKTDKQGKLHLIIEDRTISISQKYLKNELSQIAETKTLERTKYYIRRLLRGLREKKTNKVNDINLYRWKEYDDIITDSLWMLKKRDGSGAHSAEYWGNFIPQIPNQFLKRYTKKNDWVLDPFLGCGTTLIECKRLGRNGIGIELQKRVIEIAHKNLESENSTENKVKFELINADSSHINLKKTMQKLGIESVQFVLLHPPYWDIIQFSEDEQDLSNAKSQKEFLRLFGRVIDNTVKFLDKGRYFAIVIGDKYEKGEWIPLAFYTMQEVMKRGYKLKSTIVKNFDFTKGKMNQKELWRYRALVGGFYIFKHEYIFVFQK
ncbi:MAG: DNA methyltransferase [Candidatus Cloacimonadota bacterium]|nr:DNA methyltransferase [Candidatus Cloacimonadota bacterium]